MKKLKSFGQHFLNRDDIAMDIVNALQFDGRPQKVVKEDPMQVFRVLEIGPGGGVLTRFLLERKDLDLYCVEADKRLPNELRSKFPALKDRIIEADVLKVDLSEEMGGEFSIIGNFPYNISSQIIFQLLDHKDKADQLVGMFQKEVAERLAASPGSKAYGVISVLLQAYYTVDYLFTVEADCFDPPPKVRSGVIRVLRNKQYDELIDHKRFKWMVKLAFSQRRKKLRNALASVQWNEPKSERLETLLQKRAEQLHIEDFIFLCGQL